MAEFSENRHISNLINMSCKVLRIKTTGIDGSVLGFVCKKNDEDGYFTISQDFGLFRTVRLKIVLVCEPNIISS